MDESLSSFIRNRYLPEVVSELGDVLQRKGELDDVSKMGTEVKDAARLAKSTVGTAGRGVKKVAGGVKKVAGGVKKVAVKRRAMKQVKPIRTIQPQMYNAGFEY